MLVATSTTPGRYLSKMAIKKALAERDWSLKDLSIHSGLQYDRLIKLVGGYRPVRDDEVVQICAVLMLNDAAIIDLHRGDSRAS